MIHVTAMMVVRDGRGADLEAAIALARPEFLADPGCLRFDLQCVNGSDTGYAILESYESGDAVRRHGELEAFRRLAASLEGILAGPPDVTVLRPVGDQVPQS